MTDKKPPPNLAAAVEKDLTNDLKKVGGFFKGLWKFSERAERTIKTATEPEPARAPRFTGGTSDVVTIEPEPCDVCGGDGVVGGVKKIPCPACTAPQRK